MDNQITLIWDKVDLNASIERPTAREGHILLHLPDKNSYLIFGGISHTRFSGIFVLNMADKKWSSRKPTGEIPKELSHCVGWYDSKILKFIH